MTRLLVLPTFLLAVTLGGLNAAGNPPDAPSNLTGSIVAGVASLTWDVPDDDDTVVGYNVYVNNQYQTTVSSNAVDIEVEANTLYSFYVVAFDERPRRFSQSSDSLTLPESLIPDDLTIPPSVPLGLAGSIQGDTVTLTWEPSTDDEAVLGYNVYRDNQYVSTVGSASYSGADDGMPHSWYVVAFDIRTNFSSRSERIVLPDPGPVDTTLPPSVPTGLTGTVEAGSPDDTVTVNWEPSTDDQAVAGYNIYRNGQYIATRFGTEYIGSTEAGSSNAFAIVAFDFDGNFSSTSDALTLPVGSEEVDPGSPPSVPEGLAADTTTSNGQTQIDLTWQASTSTVRVAGYNVYRNNDYLTTVFAEEFSESVPAGQAVAYSIVAFDDFGNFSSRSNPLSVIGNASQAPFFSDLDDQTLRVGELWELLLRPVDVDGGAAGIFISAPPVGLEFIDNQDGSRTLRWTPLATDVGAYDITITAFDLQDTDLRTSQTITLTVVDDAPPPDSSFTLSIAQAAYNLQEGSEQGVIIPITVQRLGASDTSINLSVEADNAFDAANVTSSFTLETLDVDSSESLLNLELAIDVLPILPQQRRFIVRASDGVMEESASVTVAVSPVARDDVYLIIGQSNAVGFSEDDAKQASAGGADEPDLRIRQANLARNDSDLFVDPADFTDIALNFEFPAIVTAEDPLHEPVDPATLAKEGTRIGFPLSFAKDALDDTTRNIVLVPAAWAGSGFCNTSLPAAHWNPQPTTDPALGNTLLFDRAVARVNQTLLETGGILRGIIWHQGEADSQSACAPLYEDNLTSMVAELRSVIDEDARGSDARGAQANIPFVAGTMSRGIDDRGDLSDFTPSKMIVDSVHRNIPSLIPFGDVVINDDLVPANGFACGSGSCIHFGSEALREMGIRLHDALVRAAGS